MAKLMTLSLDPNTHRPSSPPGDSWQNWLEVAQAHLHAGLPPEQFFYLAPEDQAARSHDELALDYTTTPARQPLNAHYEIPLAFRELGVKAAAHRNPHRWSALYHVLWRLTHGESRLLERKLDHDVHELHEMVRAVEADLRRLLTRTLWHDDGSEHGLLLAWAEPEHYTLPLAAPKLVRRLGDREWSLLSRDGCAHWIDHRLMHTAGIEREFPPSEAELPLLWQEHCATEVSREMPHLRLTPTPSGF
ncbi:MAG: DUF4130 domain-containing protein [Verrucomicrobiota bacterium]